MLSNWLQLITAGVNRGVDKRRWRNSAATAEARSSRTLTSQRGVSLL